MAKGKAPGGKGSGEPFQILIMTLFMTGGGFALVSAAFYFFIIPGRMSELRDQIEDHNKVVELLDSRNNPRTLMWDLRKRVRDAEKTQGTMGLRERVEKELFGLQWSQFPKTNAVQRGNTIEHVQTIDIKEAAIQELFDFIARVKQENPSVQVGTIKLTRSTRSSRPSSPLSTPGTPALAAEDRWSAPLTFYLYTTPGAGARSDARPEPERVEEETAPEPPLEG